MSDAGDESALAQGFEHPIATGAFPLRKALNELRYRWSVVEMTAQRRADMPEGAFASTPLVTQGAWCGHTFASSAMQHFYRQYVEDFYVDLREVRSSPHVAKAKTRGRKSKRAMFTQELLKQLRVIQAHQAGGEIQARPEWADFLAK